MPKPKVTVCVSTRNRAQRLPQLLACLEAQSMERDEFEVVIVDNGSTDGTWDVLQRASEESPLQLRCLRNSPGKGPAAGRNRAWRAAIAPLCAFTDDDCSPTPSWLATVEVAMAGRAALAAGAVRPPLEEIPLIGPYTRTVFAPRHGAAWCATANLIVRRIDLEAVGGFDETFLNVAGEDTDLGLRVMARGVEFLYLPDALVEHPIEQMDFRGRLLEQQRWIDIPAVIAKNPEGRKLLLHRGLFWKRTHSGALLLAAGVASMAAGHSWGAALSWPWLHERLCREPETDAVGARVAMLPSTLFFDLSEVVVMLRGSLRHRTVVL